MPTCTKCQIEKPLYQFYVSNLSQCKDCVKSAVRAHREELLNDPAWRLKERERCRIKQERFRQNMTPEQKEIFKKCHIEANKKWRGANREKQKAHSAVGRAVKIGELKPTVSCQQCGNPPPLEAHHPDHLKALDVQWLCVPCHAKTRRLGDSPIQRRAA